MARCHRLRDNILPLAHKISLIATNFASTLNQLGQPGSDCHIQQAKKKDARNDLYDVSHGSHPRSDANKKTDVLLGARIAKFRKEKGLTQVELAKKLRIAQPVLSNYERGKLRPNHNVLASLSKVLQVSTDEMLGLQTTKGKAPLNRRFLKRLQALEKLPRRDQEALLRTIDAFLHKTS